MQKSAGIQVSKDRIPTELAEKVVPVLEVNPKLLRNCNIVKSTSAVNSTSGTLYTTPTNQDFYLCAAELSVIKDATATSTSSTITCTPKGGAASIILRIMGLTLTAQENSISISLRFPILLERGTTITVTNSTNVGNVSSSGTIFGYVVENSDA